MNALRMTSGDTNKTKKKKKSCLAQEDRIIDDRIFQISKSEEKIM